jgi:2,3,4,5-tetrahydropyridine-2-carboxylate N-succinyltransferase
MDEEAVEETVRRLDAGELRSAEKVDGAWVVNSWVKQAILLYFRLREMETIEVGPFEYRDRIPLKHDHARRESGWCRRRWRATAAFFPRAW